MVWAVGLHKHNATVLCMAYIWCSLAFDVWLYHDIYKRYRPMVGVLGCDVALGPAALGL